MRPRPQRVSHRPGRAHSGICQRRVHSGSRVVGRRGRLRQPAAAGRLLPGQRTCGARRLLERLVHGAGNNPPVGHVPRALLPVVAHALQCVHRRAPQLQAAPPVVRGRPGARFLCQLYARCVTTLPRTLDDRTCARRDARRELLEHPPRVLVQCIARSLHTMQHLLPHLVHIRLALAVMHVPLVPAVLRLEAAHALLCRVSAAEGAHHLAPQHSTPRAQVYPALHELYVGQRHKLQRVRLTLQHGGLLLAIIGEPVPEVHVVSLSPIRHSALRVLDRLRPAPDDALVHLVHVFFW